MSMDELAHPSLHRTWVEIDLTAIADNVRAFSELVGPDCCVCPCVKANAFGHGAVPVAKAALAAGAERLAVATCLEGQTLREAGIGVPIQVLGALFPEEVETAVRYNLTFSLHDLYIARLAAIAAAKAGTIVPVHVKIDTGMGRLGILPENAVAAAREIFSYPGLRFEGVFMHFADASDEEYSLWQIERFRAACRNLEEAGVRGFLRHAASSSAIVMFPDAWFDMVRPGAGIYGYLAPARLRERISLRSAMSWYAAVIQVKDYPPGANLGYNRTFTTKKPTRVAVIPVGYADGYRRECSNRAEALVKGRRARVVGMVSMDYAMLDVTDFPEVEIGTVATLLGSDGSQTISAEDLAEWGGTIPYTVTANLGERVGRLYRGGEPAEDSHV